MPAEFAVGEGILRVEADGFVVIRDSLLVLTDAAGEATVVVGEGKLRVESYRLFMVIGCVATPCQRKG